MPSGESGTLLLGPEELGKVIVEVGLDSLVDEVISELRVALLDYSDLTWDSPPRHGFVYQAPEEGLLEWMPAHRPGSLTTIKVVGYHPANPVDHGLPTIVSTISAYDPVTGQLKALADATLLTALRTGAASALASSLLAMPESRILGVIGAGAQAVSQAHALTRVLPIESIVVHDPWRGQSFEARLRPLLPEEIEVRLRPVEEILAHADVMCTATTLPPGAGPLFADGPIRPWLHINAVGADLAGKFELPVGLLRRALVVPDFPAQAIREGECQQLAPHEIGPSLADLVKEPTKAESFRTGVTVFDSTGWALEDQVAFEVLVAHAGRLGLGTFARLEWAPEDPFSPYHPPAVG